MLQAASNGKTRVYAIISALYLKAGIDVFELEELTKLSTLRTIILPEINDNPDYQLTNKKNQIVLIDYYINFFKRHKHDPNDVFGEKQLRSIEQELMHFKSLWPKHLSEVSKELIRERMADRGLVRN